MSAVLQGTLTAALLLTGALAGGVWLILLGAAAVAINVAALIAPAFDRRRDRKPTSGLASLAAAHEREGGPLGWIVRREAQERKTRGGG